MIWSFSRLNGFYTCKKMWYLSYMFNEDELNSLEITKENKFFGLYGTFGHDIFEKYNKGELELWELKDYCIENFEDNVNVDAPPNNYVNLYESYKSKMIDYFSKYDGNKHEIVSVEEEISLDLKLNNGSVIKIRGFIDLLLKNSDGDYIILDYKSKSDFKNEKELEEYARQLYLYSIGVKNKYGKYPKYLCFDMFKIGKKYEIEFNEDELGKTIEWVGETVAKIRKEDSFAPCKDVYNDFFCKYICSYGCDVCINSSSIDEFDCMSL